MNLQNVTKSIKEELSDTKISYPRTGEINLGKVGLKF